MKKCFCSSGLLAIGSLSLSLATSHAQLDRLYVKGDVGGALTSDTEVKEFFGSVPSGTKMKFDPGARFGVTAGYRVTDWFSAEAQTGVNVNTIDTITGASRADAALSNVPLLVNARFQCPKPMRFDPYFGGGLGLSISALNVNHIDFNGVSIHGSDSDAVFAYQAFAGVRYALNDRMGLSLEYHYFGTTEPSWNARNISGNIRLGGIETHAISVAFDYHF